MTASALKRTVAWRRPTDVGGLLAVLASVVLSTVGYGLLGARVRIRWSVGVHYGPEYAPTLVVLGGFPVAVSALYVGCTWLARQFERTDGFEADGRYYAFAVVGLLGVLVLVQAILIGANLYPG